MLTDLRRVLWCSLAVLLLAVPAAVHDTVPAEAAPQVDTGFAVQTVFSGLTLPTVVRFSPDGRVFVAEKSGLVKVFDSMTDPTATTAVDISADVHSFWDRGLLGMALDPDFPASPYVYLLYTWDRYRYGDTCPTPPGATTDGCLADGRLVRIPVDAANRPGTTQVLLDGNFCQQFPSHSIGSVEFGPEGALYVTSGDGASFNTVDVGQLGGSLSGTPTPVNPCQDPPSEGGALRSQDLRTSGDALGFDGTLMRLDPDTGNPWPGNPGGGRILAHGFRNPFRAAIAPNGHVYVGDVGWNTWEEINHVPNASSVRNYGWPCYEGTARMGSYDAADVPLCESLYAQGSGAVTAPLFEYRHGVALDACPEVQGNSSAISGLAIYPGGTYPNAYDGALFFTDYSRACLWVMYPGAGGVPDPSTVDRFATEEPSVGLFAGPGGDIFSLDHVNGRIRRIVSTGVGNQLPTATLVADPQSGQAPLTVAFDGSASTDPDGAPLQFAWDLDGDGQLDDAFTPTATHTYTAPGTYAVRLRVDDGHGGTDEATTQVVVQADANQPPTAHIDTPTSATTWAVGDTVTLQGGGVDPDGGALDHRWDLGIVHCSATPPFDCHTHPLETRAGATSSFSAPDHDYPARLSVTLTVTDPGGLSDSETVEILPRTRTLTVDTVPDGLQAFLGGAAVPEGQPQTVIERSTQTLSVPTPQVLGEHDYQLVGWSDGSTSAIRTTTVSENQTFTAQFNGLPQARVTATPTTGKAPLTVQFSAAGSVDPEGAALTYVWDLDGDGQLDDATGAAVSHTFTTKGNKRVTARVTDSFGASSSASVTVTVKPGRR